MEPGALFGYFCLVSFMQPATALAVMLILLLSLVYKNRVLSANNNLRNI